VGSGQRADAIGQLKRQRGALYGRLKKVAPQAIPIVAEALSRTLGAERKMLDFVTEYAPAPPVERPREWGRVDWNDLEQALRILYDHRSRDLHDGIPFPEPLCQPPEVDDRGVPAERFGAIAMSGRGGAWPAERLPMYLHTFVYLAGSSLRKWWQELAAEQSQGPFEPVGS